jgi:hypothetical protein
VRIDMDRKDGLETMKLETFMLYLTSQMATEQFVTGEHEKYCRRSYCFNGVRLHLYGTGLLMGPLSLSKMI